MSHAIRIDDLREPRLSPAQQAAIDATSGLQVELSVDGVLAAARERTGLADFGPDDFLERLGLLVDEWGSDAAMRPLQRLNLRNYLVRYASNRLLLQDLWTRHPEILQTPIPEPIIVAGLPRSGTTHLVNLIAADRRLRSLPLWESYEPVPLPGEGLLADGTDPRYRRCAEAWAEHAGHAAAAGGNAPDEPGPHPRGTGADGAGLRVLQFRVAEPPRRAGATTTTPTTRRRTTST